MTEVLGWFSSLVLLATIGVQISKQWREGSSEGVSPFLFVGQMAASIGFTVYSALLKNWIFTFTNGMMTLSAILGLVVCMRFKHRGRARGGAARAEA